MSTENPAFGTKGNDKKPNMMQRISNLTRGKKQKELVEMERTSTTAKPKAKKSKSVKMKKPKKTDVHNLSQELDLTAEEAKVQKQIQASPEFQKFAAKIEKKAANGKGNKFRFLQGKKRKVGKVVFEKAYNHEKIHKLGYLTKQGAKIKNWKRRFFVVKSKMIFYFENLEAYNDEKPPKGWIYFKDILPTKKNFVCTPTNQFIWRGKFNAFLLQTEKRTFALAGKGKEDRLGWMKVIRQVYEEFWTGYGLPIPQSPKSPDDETGTLAQLRPIAEKLETYDELEQNELEDKTRLLMLKQCMIRWKTYVKIAKLEEKS